MFFYFEDYGENVRVSEAGESVLLFVQATRYIVKSAAKESMPEPSAWEREERKRKPEEAFVFSSLFSKKQKLQRS